MIKKEVKDRLYLAEKLVKTKINFTLFSTKDLIASEEKGDSFLFKYSKSKVHNTDYLINATFYKTILQNFTMPENYEK